MACPYMASGIGLWYWPHSMPFTGARMVVSLIVASLPCLCRIPLLAQHAHLCPLRLPHPCRFLVLACHALMSPLPLPPFCRCASLFLEGMPWGGLCLCNMHCRCLLIGHSAHFMPFRLMPRRRFYHFVGSFASNAILTPQPCLIHYHLAVLPALVSEDVLLRLTHHPSCRFTGLCSHRMVLLQRHSRHGCITGLFLILMLYRGLCITRSTILSDRGPPFRAQLATAVYKLLGTSIHNKHSPS